MRATRCRRAASWTIITGNAQLDAGYAAQHPRGDARRLRADRGQRHRHRHRRRRSSAASSSRSSPPRSRARAPGSACMVFGFVKQSGGHIDGLQRARPGHDVPHLSAAGNAGDGDGARTRRDRRPLAGGDETILVVEDNAQLRRVARAATARARLSGAGGGERRGGARDRCRGETGRPAVHRRGDAGRRWTASSWPAMR